jgi:hypothetical protein
MKQIIVLVLLLNCGYVRGQKLLPLPTNGKAGKCYKQCLKYDSTVVNPDPYAVIPPFGWEEVLLQNTEAQQRFEIEAPRFDTVLLKIPVDKVTRMAQLPDEYGLIADRITTSKGVNKWVRRQSSKEELKASPSNCLAICLVEVPAVYKTDQKLVLKSTAHQQRYDDIDTIVFKQVIETKPMTKTFIEEPPQYEKVFRKVNPQATYYNWRILEINSCSSSSLVREIQIELKRRGYSSGQIDNVLGTKTKAALIQFQKENKLKVGILGRDTLKALGLDRDKEEEVD